MMTTRSLTMFERLQGFANEFVVDVDSDGVTMTRFDKELRMSIKKTWIEIESANFDVLEVVATTLRSARHIVV